MSDFGGTGISSPRPLGRQRTQPHREQAFISTPDPALRSTRDRRARRTRRARPSETAASTDYASTNYDNNNTPIGIPRGVSPLPPAPENLHDLDSDAFNVDPNMPYLASASRAGGASQPYIDGSRPPQTYSPPEQVQHDERRFVGGFFTGLKRAVKVAYESQKRGQSQRQRHRTMSTSTGASRVVDPGFKPTLAPPPPGSYYQGSPPPPPPPPQSQSGPSQAKYYHDDTPKIPPDDPELQRYAQDASVRGGYGYGYGSGHGHETEETGETTVVNHELLPPAPGVDLPMLFEPLPGSDYAKMDSPPGPPSGVSFRTYMSRIQQFLRAVNELPWVAEERVTVDYVPGQSRRRRREGSQGEGQGRRPILSWYNPNQQFTVDLLSGSSPDGRGYYSNAPPVPMQKGPGEEDPIPMQGMNPPFAYPNSNSNYPYPTQGTSSSYPRQGAGTSSYPVQDTGATSTSNYTRRVPVPQLDSPAPPPPIPKSPAVSSTPMLAPQIRYPPLYPNGYVPYQPTDLADRPVHGPQR